MNWCEAAIEPAWFDHDRLAAPRNRFVVELGYHHHLVGCSVRTRHLDRQSLGPDVDLVVVAGLGWDLVRFDGRH